MASFSYVFKVSVSRSFFDRLGVGFGVDFGAVWAPKWGLCRGVWGSIFGIVFVMVFSVAGWLAQAPQDLRARGWGRVTRPSRGPTKLLTDSRLTTVT